MRLLLGCGLTRIEGYVRVDYDKAVKPDFIVNLDKLKPWPFKDNSIEEIKASNLLEHIKNIDFFMEECYRILEPEGLLHILVPHGRNHMAYSDPDHIRFFFPETFIYWSRSSFGSDGRPITRANCDFKIEKVTTHINSKAIEKFKTQEEKEFAMHHYWDVCTFINAKLRTIKPVRGGNIGKYGVQEDSK